MFFIFSISSPFSSSVLLSIAGERKRWREGGRKDGLATESSGFILPARSPRDNPSGHKKEVRYLDIYPGGQYTHKIVIVREMQIKTMR